MPFPFLPVVLDAPKAAPAHSASGTSGKAALPEVAEASRRTGAGRAKPRTSRRGNVAEAAQPPGMDAECGNALRIEVVRRIAPECLTVLGAIVR
ncbi:hypothetical protein [Pandoraea anhela]|uniref:hypothetical protein n=1 Tax=Pandoraea anhela TaxID=2508295 RepID=UPI001240B3C0|nr:hypothetical protein [Pandoraea anhela]